MTHDTTFTTHSREVGMGMGGGLCAATGGTTRALPGVSGSGAVKPGMDVVEPGRLPPPNTPELGVLLLDPEPSTHMKHVMFGHAAQSGGARHTVTGEALVVRIGMRVGLHRNRVYHLCKATSTRAHARVKPHTPQHHEGSDSWVGGNSAKRSGGGVLQWRVVVNVEREREREPLYQPPSWCRKKKND
jgi:hypothetical protein